VHGQSLACYRLREWPGSYDEYVNLENHRVTKHGPIDFGEFEAMLYIAASPPHPPSWAPLLAQGFNAIETAQSASSGALLIVSIEPGEEHEFFAFAFGVLGRHLLKDYKWTRGYGLRTALNLIFPVGTNPKEMDRLVSLDSRRHSEEVLRSRLQSGRATSVDSFNIDHLQDVVGAATGRPGDENIWGSKISGSDALHFSSAVPFEKFGNLCLEISVAHDRTDYKEHFSWIDDVLPISDPLMVDILEASVLNLITSANSNLDLSPPEIVDWTRVRTFQFDFDKRKNITRPDLRLRDFVRGLESGVHTISIDVDLLKRRQVYAKDDVGPHGEVVHSWSVWRCLSGDIKVNGSSFVLDNGEFFEVSSDYLGQLDGFIGSLRACSLEVPIPSKLGMHEEDYNKELAASLSAAIVLDRKTVKSSSKQTPVEICDVLTDGKKLIHVKRGLSARELSHLFAQGATSAELLQEDQSFRTATNNRICEVTTESGFNYFDVPAITTSEFEVAFVIVTDWKHRPLANALPFFSKVNLRRTVLDLVSRGFRVTCTPVNDRPEIAFESVAKT
jgi:uncharacterized protein (TIGR04141 family)